MESLPSGQVSGRSTQVAAVEAETGSPSQARSASRELIDSETERSARERVFDEVLASVELVLVADGAAFWR